MGRCWTLPIRAADQRGPLTLTACNHPIARRLGHLAERSALSFVAVLQDRGVRVRLNNMLDIMFSLV